MLNIGQKFHISVFPFLSFWLWPLRSYNPPFPLGYMHLAGNTISPTNKASTMQYSYIKERTTVLLLVLNIKWQNGLETKSTYFEPKIRYCSNLCSIFCLCRSPGPHQINQIIRYLIWSILITSTNTTSEYREYIKNLAKSKNTTNKPREYQEYYRNKHEWSIHKLRWLWMTNLQVISCRKMEDMLYLHSGMD